MTETRRKTKPASSTTPPLSNEAEESKSSSASFISAPARKYGKSVTVFYNHPRSIIFNVEDARGEVHYVQINGNNTHLKGLPKGIQPLPGTYGRTDDVDGELWEAVEKKYAGMPCFANGLIFAVNAGDDASGEIKARRTLRNGYEPINPLRSHTQPGTRD